MLELISFLVTPGTISVAFIVFCLTYYVTNTPGFLRMPPGPFPFPVIGNLHELAKKTSPEHVHRFQTLASKYGNLVSLKMGSKYVIVVSDYKMMVELFVKNSDFFLDRPDLTLIKYLNTELGAGIITNNGQSWKRLRRLALTTMRDFGVGKQSLEEKIQEEIRVLLEVFSQQKDQPFYTKPLFNMATSNVISQVIFGSRFDYDDAKFKELLRILDVSLTINPVFTPINFLPFLRFIPFFTKPAHTFCKTLLTTSDYVNSLAADNEESFDPENIRDFVDLFIKMKREHSDDDTYDKRGMARVIVDLFTAGSDSTATTLSWLMLYMAKYPHVQKKCQQDIDRVVGKGKMPTLADKANLPYIEATILEVLRIRPPTPIAAPHCSSKDLEFYGYAFPKDTIVVANVIDINKDPSTFPNPDAFLPEHFLNREGQVINRDRMVSFSLGPRACIGEILAKMELFLFFTAILQFFTISPEPGKPLDFTPFLGLVLRHKVQNVVFTRRE